MAHSRDDLHQIKTQSSAISHHLVDFMLKRDGIQLKCNYSHAKLMRGLLEKDKGFKDAISTLETCCTDLKLKHQQEIEGRVKTLDISHQQLYAEYQDSCSRLMVDDIKWGKIAVLLFFTSVLAKRLYEENKTPLIDSIVGWQTTFLHDFTQWILEHGGWGAIQGAVSIDASEKAKERTENQRAENRRPTGWLTVAAISLGVTLVGALTFK
ncbi:bcl-2-like protein 1 isoform X2 [Halichondria panicea]|uniref:bcl-2-like protein 1 isoform X2 n=1 Tax=Halichondria panicea TaxID=6063 RepID=UPI00312BA7C4